MKKLDTTEGDINVSPLRTAWEASQLDHATKTILAEDAKWFLHQSLSTPCLNVLQSANGSELLDIQGRPYLDFHGNSVHQLGYAHPVVLARIQEQMETLSFCPRRYTNSVAVELARRLCEASPIPDAKVLFAPGGATAISMALKLARVCTGRFKTISWWGAFHGATLDAISVGGESVFREGMGPLMPGAIHIPPPNSYRSEIGSGSPDPMASVEHLEYVLRHEGDFAAFIAEPIRCTEVMQPPAAYWRRVRELCDEYGVLLIFDEIPTGLGRTGKTFSSNHYDVVPDMICLGKGLGGGVLPLAALIARGDLDRAGAWSLGHFTHEKNPVLCAAGLATLDVIEQEGLNTRAAELGVRVLEKLRALQKKHLCIGDVRGVGLLLGVELVKDRETRIPANELAERALYACLRRGLSFKVSSGNILTLMPPLNISQEDLDKAMDILDVALAESTVNN